nr:immunoglobulin light chain junction region [Macaca mulatta]MOX30925.1 immunoglobulin light chain junction region [Macaca mulatta]
DYYCATWHNSAGVF